MNSNSQLLKTFSTKDEQFYDIELKKDIASGIPISYLQSRRIVELMAIMILAPLIFPTMAIISVCLFLLDKGPVFFIQRRLGKDGKLFRMCKFRTMRPNCDNSYLTRSNDERITSIGRILRNTKLDELPQFVNVLKGDMSIIGPRPVPENFFHLYVSKIPHYPLRHVIRPGITGWAQVRLGYTDTLEQERLKFQLDLEYIRNIGPSYDLQILWRTFLSVVGTRPSIKTSADTIG